MEFETVREAALLLSVLRLSAEKKKRKKTNFPRVTD